MANNIANSACYVNSSAVISGFGQFHTNEIDPRKPKKLTPYTTITLDGIRHLISHPQQVAKEQAQWVIPSTYPSRVFAEQEANGVYQLLWVDIDERQPSLAKILAIVGGVVPKDVNYELYTTASAMRDSVKARLILWLDTPLNFNDWTLCQEVLNDKFESCGILPDRATQRSAQLCYLPNRGEFYDSRCKRDGSFFNPLDIFCDEITVKRELLEQQAKEIHARIEEANRKKSTLTTNHSSLIEAFNSTYCVEGLLLQAGYSQRGNTFRHPNSESGSYSASIRDGRVHSLSSNDPLYTGGGGGGAHDPFSVFTTLFCSGDRNIALKEAGDQWLTIGSESWNRVKQREYVQSKNHAEIANDFKQTITTKPQVKDKLQSAMAVIPPTAKPTNKIILDGMEWEVREEKFIKIAEIKSAIEFLKNKNLVDDKSTLIKRVLSCCEEGKEIYQKFFDKELMVMKPLHPKKLYFEAYNKGWGKDINPNLAKEQHRRMLRNANRLWGIANIEGKAVFIEKARSRISDSFDLRFTSTEAATLINLPLKIPIVITTDKDERIEWKNLISIWNVWEFRHTFRDFYFSPKPIVNEENVELPKGDLLNLFTGLAIAPKIGVCEKILDHIFEIWCSSDPIAYKYVIGWLATMYQNPNDRGHTAIVLKSGEGTGKNIILDIIAESWGRHGITISEANQVTGRFNDHLSTAVFVFLNEALWGGDKSHEGALKRLITDKTLEVERKYVPRFEVKNCVHLMLSTNNDWAVPVGIDDRRFFILDVNEGRKGDLPYFEALANEIKNGGDAALINHLLHYDIKEFNPRIIPRGLECATRTYNDQKLRTANSVYKWWAYCLEIGFIIEREDGMRGKEIIPKFWETEEALIDKSDAYTTYAQWCKLHQHRTESLPMWTRFLKQFGATIGENIRLSTGSRPRGVRVNTIEVMRNNFNILLTR